jgi:homoserine dehydrogenase
MLGIVNGTTNYVLTQMSERGWTFEAALAEAQRLGYAEADPTADVDGFDAAAKCAILASIAFNTRVVASDVYREGIARITPQDIADADRLGYVVKLLAIAELDDGEVSARVHPAMIPATHPLASVRDANNAVFVEGAKVGQLMFYGPGAGGDATATSVVGDLVHVGATSPSAARDRMHVRPRPRDPSDGRHDRPVLPQPPRGGSAGVLAEIAEAFAHNGVSIERVWQEGFAEEATLVFITHRAQEGAFQKTVAELRDRASVRAVASLLRVEGEE